MASIFSLFGEVFVDNDKANKSIDDTAKKGSSMGDKLSGAFSAIGKGALAVGAAATTAGVGIFKLASSAASTADAIDKNRQALGMSVQGYQEWGYVLGQNGADIEQLGTAIKTLSGVMDGSSKTGTAALDKLGISLKGMNQEQAFKATVKGLQGIKDETLKAQLAQDLYGRSYQDLMPLLNQTTESTDELIDRSHELGLIMSEDAVDAGVVFGDTMDDLTKSFGMIFTQLGANLMPIITQLMDFIIANMPMIQSLFDEFAPVIMNLLETLAPIFMQIVEQLFPPLMDMITALLPLFDVLVETILPPILDLLVQLMPIFTDIVVAILPVIVQLITALLPLIEPIFAILEPVFDILLLLLDPLLDLLDLILPPLTKIIEVLADIIERVLGNAFESIKPIIEAFANILSGIIDFITGVFEGDWSKAWDGIVNIFKGIFNLIPTIIENVLNGGIFLINAIIDGINAVTGLIGIPEIPNIDKVKLPRLKLGLDYVPYDDFPALLHKGEKVLTSEQAAEYRDGGRSSGVTININGATIMRPDDVDWLLDLMTRRLKEVGVSV